CLFTRRSWFWQIVCVRTNFRGPGMRMKEGREAGTFAKRTTSDATHRRRRGEAEMRAHSARERDSSSRPHLPAISSRAKHRPAALAGKIVGVDVGGTFTDLILMDASGRDLRVAKVPTTVENQAFGVLAALDATGVPLADVATIIHGTTATTNALLERKIATAGLITTKGCRDVLERGRRARPQPYGL